VKVAVSAAAALIVTEQVLSAQAAAAPVPLERRPGCWPAGAFAAIPIVDPIGIWNVQVVDAGVEQRPPPAPMTATVPDVLPPTVTVSVDVCATAGRATSQDANVNPVIRDSRFTMGICGSDYCSVTLMTALALKVLLT
jgi:hypothetical protein